MSDVDNHDGLHEDESGEEEEDGWTQEERREDEEIEEYITSHPLVKIGGKTYDRRTVTEIEVGEGVTEIEDNIFRCCKNLSSVKLSSTILSIGARAFYLNKSLRSIKLPKYLVTLSWGAFRSSSLRSIVIPNTVTHLGHNLFNSCKYLTSVTLPNKYHPSKAILSIIVHHSRPSFFLLP